MMGLTHLNRFAVTGNWIGIDESKVDTQDGLVGKVGYGIPLTRDFYKYQAPRELEEIESNIASVEKDLQNMLKELEILA
jgi:type I restriction enzyme M protein